MPFEVQLTLYIVLATAAGLGLLAWLLYSPIKRFLYKHYTVRMYYRKIYRVALDHDYYLVNKFVDETAETEEFHIDHILIGEKYIYCIRDRYYDGAIAAKEDNDSWIFFRNKKNEYIKNPMIINKARVQRLSLNTGIDEKLFISVVLINDDCFITPLEGNYDDSFLSSLHDFPRLIEQIESRPVDPLDEKAIALAAKDFAELKKTHGEK